MGRFFPFFFFSFCFVSTGTTFAESQTVNFSWASQDASLRFACHSPEKPGDRFTFTMTALKTPETVDIESSETKLRLRIKSLNEAAQLRARLSAGGRTLRWQTKDPGLKLTCAKTGKYCSISVQLNSPLVKLTQGEDTITAELTKPEEAGYLCTRLGLIQNVRIRKLDRASRQPEDSKVFLFKNHKLWVGRHWGPDDKPHYAIDVYNSAGNHLGTIPLTHTPMFAGLGGEGQLVTMGFGNEKYTETNFFGPSKQASFTYEHLFSFFSTIDLFNGSVRTERLPITVPLTTSYTKVGTDNLFASSDQGLIRWLGRTKQSLASERRYVSLAHDPTVPNEVDDPPLLEPKKTGDRIRDGLNQLKYRAQLEAANIKYKVLNWKRNIEQNWADREMANAINPGNVEFLETNKGQLGKSTGYFRAPLQMIPWKNTLYVLDVGHMTKTGDETVVRIDLETKTARRVFKDLQFLERMVLLPAQGLLVTVDTLDHKLLLVDAETGTFLRSLSIPYDVTKSPWQPSEDRTIALAEYGKCVVTALRNRRLLTFTRLDSGEIVDQWDVQKELGPLIRMADYLQTDPEIGAVYLRSIFACKGCTHAAAGVVRLENPLSPVHTLCR